MPLWAQLLFAALSGGTLAKAIDLIAFRERNVYHMMGLMQARIDTLEKEVHTLRVEKHNFADQLNAARLERTLLQFEVNELCTKAGIEPRYANLLLHEKPKGL